MIRPINEKTSTGYYLETDEEKINYFLNSFKSVTDVNSSKLQELFSHQHKKDKNGKYIIDSPKYYTSDSFIIKKGYIGSIQSDIETTFGIYLFNFFCLWLVFGDSFNYYNKTVTKDNNEELQQLIVDGILKKKYTTEQFIKYQDSFLFLSFKSELWNVGNSWNLLAPNKKILAYKKKLLEDHKDDIDPKKHADFINRYTNYIEKPLQNYAKEILKTDPSWPMYERGAKPVFGNSFKNMNLDVGPVYDPISGDYVIIDKALTEGMDNDKINNYANIFIHAGYSRAVSTQDGGALTKYLFSAMQSVHIGEKDSDCGTKRYILKKITKKNFKKNILRYVSLNNEKWTLLTDENKDKYIDKIVKMRSPQFCEDKYYCNMCVGDFPYEINLKNIGNSTTVATSTLLNKSLKAMHSTEINLTNINLIHCIDEVN
jgi:hypothetical protein